MSWEDAERQEMLADRLEDARAHEAALREAVVALLSHVHHSAGCATRRDVMTACTCGLDAVRMAAEKAMRE